jgi:peptidoglycan lytic transglycosylase
MPRTLTLFALIALMATPVLAQDVEVGYASWYNRGFNGLSTASGEAYDHESLTAAHPSLPFGTMLQVTRVDDGRSISVRINDRMQSGPGHVIDLSGAAARELGLLDTGVARVRLNATADGTTTATIIPAGTRTGDQTHSGSYTLQLGVFSSRAAAQDLATQFDGAWIQSIPAQAGSMYRVYYQSFDGEAQARSVQAGLTTSGVESFLRMLQ